MGRSCHLLCLPAAFVVCLLSSPVSAKCMSRSITQPDGTKGTSLVVAPDTGFADLDAAGYQDASCGTIDKAAYMDRVCNPASWGNSGIQRQFAIQAGITLAQLCSAARQDASLPDVTPDEMANRFLPPNSQGLGSAAANTAVPPGPGMKRPLVGPLGQAAAATNQVGGQ